MGINLVTFYNSTVTPQDDALIYENALPGSGMIYGGNVTIKNANTLHVTAGHGALCGRKFTIEETDVPVQLTSSGTLNGRLYIHMDLSNVDEPITLEVERASTLTPPVQQSNVNITDGIFEINLATFQISTSTISNLVYVAPFIHYEFLKEVIIAPVEKTNVASQNYVVGRHLVLNNILYKVTAAITAGQTIAVGTNVAVSDDVEKQIETNLSSINTNINSINTINGNKLNQTVIATRQANLTASKAYVVGEQFIYNNTLYEVTAAISKNAAITIGGNCKAANNITTQISKINLDISSAQATDSGWGLNISVNLIQKSGKTVCVQFSCTRPNGQDMIPNAYSICNIPSGFRPNMVVGYFSGFLYKSGGPNQRKAVTFEIRQDGYVKTGYGIDTTGYDSMLLACTYFTQ